MNSLMSAVAVVVALAGAAIAEPAEAAAEYFYRHYGKKGPTAGGTATNPVVPPDDGEKYIVWQYASGWAFECKILDPANYMDNFDPSIMVHWTGKDELYLGGYSYIGVPAAGVPLENMEWMCAENSAFVVEFGGTSDSDPLVSAVLNDAPSGRTPTRPLPDYDGPAEMTLTFGNGMRVACRLRDPIYQLNDEDKEMVAFLTSGASTLQRMGTFGGFDEDGNPVSGWYGEIYLTASHVRNFYHQGASVEMPDPPCFDQILLDPGAPVAEGEVISISAQVVPMENWSY